MDPAAFVRAQHRDRRRRRWCRKSASTSPPRSPRSGRRPRRRLARGAVPPPFWAFAWAGGQALARYLLDHPGEVAGREVLDFGSGSGLVAIAAAMAGARSRHRRRDRPFRRRRDRRSTPRSTASTSRIETGDLLDRAAAGWRVVLAGDVCYEQPMAARATAWLRRSAARGRLVLLGDPGRAYLPARRADRARPLSRCRPAANSKTAKCARRWCGRCCRRMMDEGDRPMPSLPCFQPCHRADDLAQGAVGRLVAAQHHRESAAQPRRQRPHASPAPAGSRTASRGKSPQPSPAPTSSLMASTLPSSIAGFSATPARRNQSSMTRRELPPGS